MKPSRTLIGLATLAMLCGCGGGGSTSSTTSSTSPSTTPSPSQSQCQAAGDSVQPNVQPLIEISPTGAASPTTVTTQAPLTCYTTLSVAQGGSATATFGTVTACLVSQTSPGGVGTLVSRFPMPMLFSLVEGAVTCVSQTAQGLEAQVCGKGTVHITTSSTSWDATCAADGTFRIAVFRGSLQVNFRGGMAILHPLSRLVFAPSIGPKVYKDISFGAAELSIFNRLKP